MKTILIFLAFLFVVNYGFCQDWYQNVTTVSAAGIVYKVDRSKYTVLLSNVDNVFTQQPNWRYKDGAELKTEEEYDVVDCRMISMDGLLQAFGETFTEDELAPLRLLKRSPLSIFYAVGPDGNILELSFIIECKPAMMAIPPFKFSMLERKIKSYVKFKVNHYGQKLQFMHGGDFVNFSTMQLIRDVPPGGFDVEFEE